MWGPEVSLALPNRTSMVHVSENEQAAILTQREADTCINTYREELDPCTYHVNLNQQHNSQVHNHLHAADRHIDW